jgi:hypothetical protein
MSILDVLREQLDDPVRRLCTDFEGNQFPIPVADDVLKIVLDVVDAAIVCVDSEWRLDRCDQLQDAVEDFLSLPS